MQGHKVNMMHKIKINKIKMQDKKKYNTEKDRVEKIVFGGIQVCIK